MSGRYAKGNQKMLEGRISWSTQDFKAVLLTAAYTVDLDADEFLDDLTGVLSTSPNLGSKTSTLGVAGCEDIVFGSVTGAQGTQMVCTGTPAARRPHR